MKRLKYLLMGLAFAACQENEATDDFTGNETTYSLQSASQYAISGTITFKERKDGATTASVALNGTNGDQKFPVHLHLGDLATPAADIAVLLSPVTASTGKSETKITELTNETSITYTQLLDLEACIKIHLAESGPDRDIILSAGNIGKSSKLESTNGRLGISICKSE
jgi:hypothetical protein